MSTLFLTQLAAASSARLELTGTLDVGAETGPLSGSLTYVGSDSDETLTIALGGNPSTTHTIHRIGVGYTKVDDGPWLQDPAPPVAGQDLSTVLKGLTGLTDAGLETKDGAPLHRLEVPAGTPIDPAAFGLTSAAVTNPQVGLVFYAADDGTPAYISVTATWTQGGVAVKMTIDFRFVQIGGALHVVSPDHVWSRYTSKRLHYGMDYPETWHTYLADKRFDYFQSQRDSYVAVDRFSAPGSTANGVAKATIAYDEATYKFTLNGNESYLLAGVKARLLTFHATRAGSKVVIYEVIAVRSGYVFDLFWSSPIGNEAADRTTFLEMLSTFAYT